MAGAALAAAALLAAPAARAGCTVGQLAELPVTLVGLKAMAPVTLNGAERMMAVDSGAFFSILSPASAAELHLPLRALPPGFTLSGVGGDAFVQLTTVDRFGLAKAVIPRIDFLVGGGEVGGAAAGVIGQNVLGLADVEYDLEHGAVRLMRPSGCRGVNFAYWAGAKPVSVVRLEWVEGSAKFTIVPVTVNGTRLRALLDSGAATSGLTLEAARRIGLKPDGPGVRPAGLSRGFGRRAVRTWIGPVASFDLGDEEIRNTHLRFTDLNLPKADMLLGADFLLSHRVYVANSQNLMFFTYDGGPVFNLETATEKNEAPAGAPPLPAAAGAAPEAPTDAQGFARRAAAHAARREFSAALADDDASLKLKPDQPDVLVQRAQAHGALDQPALAAADLDAALKLAPDDARAHLLRAELRLHEKDREGARTDLDAAARGASKEADLRLRLGELYAELDATDAAIDQYGLWITTHGDDSRMAQALRGRCWARALAGRELDRALSDCNGALSRGADPGVGRGTRGLVELRRGDLARAVADFTAALAAHPKGAWWLYGRGLAELRAGQTAQGEADLAAAAAAAPGLPARAAKLGLAPPAATPAAAPPA